MPSDASKRDASAIFRGHDAIARQETLPRNRYAIDAPSVHTALLYGAHLGARETNAMNDATQQMRQHRESNEFSSRALLCGEIVARNGEGDERLGLNRILNIWC